MDLICKLVVTTKVFFMICFICPVNFTRDDPLLVCHTNYEQRDAYFKWDGTGA